MGRALSIREDVATPEQLREMARSEWRPRTRLRLLAVADLLDGRRRVDVTLAHGLDRQALHDAVRNFNRDGVHGLVNRPRGHRKPILTEAERTAVVTFVQNRQAVGWRISIRAVRDFVEAEFGKVVHPWSVARLLKGLVPDGDEPDPEAGAASRSSAKPMACEEARARTPATSR